MKIKIGNYSNGFNYSVMELSYIQEQYDYVFKHLDFDKIDKYIIIHFSNEEIKEWFHKTFIKKLSLNTIYKESPNGYQWLKDNWCKNMFTVFIEYQDKQKLITIVNKIINVELTRGNNEN